MNICIIGPEKRTNTEIKLVEKAPRFFDSVLYVPVQNIRIESIEGKSIPFYKDKNLLNFEVIIPRFTRASQDFGYTLLRIFEDNKIFVPMKHMSVLFGYNEFLVPLFLKEAGITTPRLYFCVSRTALEKKIPHVNFPILLRLPYHKKGEMILNSESSLKGVMDTLERLSQPIMIEEIAPINTPLNVLVIGTKTYAIKDGREEYRLSASEHHLLLETARRLGCNFCQIDALKMKGEFVIRNLNIYPDISYFEKILKEEDLFAELLLFMRERTKIRAENNLFGKFLDWFSEVRWG